MGWVPIVLPPQRVEENPAVRVVLLQKGDGCVLQPRQVNPLVEGCVEEQQRQLEASCRHCSNNIEAGRVGGNADIEEVRPPDL